MISLPMRTSTITRRSKLALCFGAQALILASSLPAYSQAPAVASPQTGKVATTAPLPFPMGSSFSRGLQKATGITTVTQFVAGQVVQRVLQKKLGGQVRVKVRTWSLTDLLSGKIKSMEIKLKSSQYKNVPMGKIVVTSDTPVWLRYRRENNDRAGLRTPILLRMKAHLTQENVADALAVGRVASSLRALKLDLPGLGAQELQVLDPHVTMAEKLITVKATLVTKGAARDTGVDLTVTGKPELKGDDRIVLSNMAIECPDIVEPKKFAGFVEELLNPLVNFHHFDRRNFALRLDSLTLAEGGLDAEGRILVAPNTPPSVANNNSQH
jgi:hypothetical protein